MSATNGLYRLISDNICICMIASLLRIIVGVSYLYKYIFCLFVDNLYALSIIVVMKCMSFRFSAKRFNFEKH